MSATSSDKEWLENAEQAESTNSHASEYPTHPLSQLQGPFEESITESADPKYLQWQVFIDTQSRRDQILTSPKYERLCGRRWRQRPGERYHPLWKIVAQISFGLHLLANDLAKSEIHVVKILQTHVSDIDGFIERTTDDLQLALNDITERFDLLRLPLENLSIFSEMLEDPTFRQSVIIDNERIEHIITRSTLAMDDSLKDIRKGNESVNGLAFYIKEVGKEWVDRPPELDPICEAMVGNVDGWNRELRRLKRSVHKLAIALTQMTRYSLEIQRLVGVASRKGVVLPSSFPSIKLTKKC
ncbi:hypothetical protein BGW36DRAFT_285257 [Talaromyces proteolyticus]|uniref:Uncharacterized protein n=1 Tax=Talaromyces proteolyticus TaxID=1131652 RepID=A0AAD4L509_9EURO|nr:uncharacterized protein BGW36DRAFT_285257 [Talaromyces proteolyticus]KAH8704720.1 hypothetical protein BGW36DRAFT_285257 [Talaromyces proteolyticus]